MKTCTLSTLVEDTGETPRVLQHWTDLGVLKVLRSTSRKGRGNRRVYRAEPLYGERKYALLAQALNALRLPLGEIKNVILGDRIAYDPIDTLDHEHVKVAQEIRDSRIEDQKNYPGFVHPYEAALAGEPNVFAVLAIRPDDPVKPLHCVYTRDTSSNSMLFSYKRNKVLAGTPEAQAYIDKADADEKKAKDFVNAKSDQANYGMVRNLMANNPTAVVLNLSKIFEPLYSNPEPIETDDEAD